MNCIKIGRHNYQWKRSFFMAKFTVEDKIRTVREYLDGLKMKKDIVKLYDVNRQVHQQWIDLYWNHGDLGKRGNQLDPKTVLKLMKAMGLTCRIRMKKYRSYRGNVGKVAPNVLDREFTD